MTDVESRIRTEGRNALGRICADVYHTTGAGPIAINTLVWSIEKSRTAYEDMVAVTLFYRLQAQGSTLDPIDTQDVMRWLLAAVNRYCADRYKREHLEAEAEEAETA